MSFTEDMDIEQPVDVGVTVHRHKETIIGRLEAENADLRKEVEGWKFAYQTVLRQVQVREG